MHGMHGQDFRRADGAESEFTRPRVSERFGLEVEQTHARYHLALVRAPFFAGFQDRPDLVSALIAAITALYREQLWPAVAAGSALMAIGGAFLTMSAFNAFFFNMVNGRGLLGGTHRVNQRRMHGGQHRTAPGDRRDRGGPGQVRLAGRAGASSARTRSSC